MSTPVPPQLFLQIHLIDSFPQKQSGAADHKRTQIGSLT